jgi:2-phospho-L-lactate guanylyltransferase
VSCWVVIPIKALNDCKTRLRPALDDGARRALVRSMLDNVIHAAQSARLVDNIALLGPNRHNASASIELIRDDGADLNAALHGAALKLKQATRIIFVAADLPRVTTMDIETLASADGAAIAPDRSGSGTNALSLPAPSARAFRFQFGPGSFDLHCGEADRLALPTQIVSSDTLALDIDTPEDLDTLRGLNV